VTRLNITAEGFSEERFVKDILYHHLLQFDIYTDVRKVLTSRKLKKRGGIVGYHKFKNDVTQWLKEDPKAYHTTLIDLYGLSNDFPGVIPTKGQNGNLRAKIIESLILKDIDFDNFLPFVQPHEYEALLFSDPDKMYQWLSVFNAGISQRSFHKIREAVNNPEEINDSPETSPSNRILKLCSSYDKIDDGVLILKEIGLKQIRSACPHFNEWVLMLEGLNK
jgi:hypothetical protein